MLSHNYRIHLESICSRIVKSDEVSLSDMVWAASRLLRRVDTPDMAEGDLYDWFKRDGEDTDEWRRRD
jgi:hypothetical protein